MDSKGSEETSKDSGTARAQRRKGLNSAQKKFMVGAVIIVGTIGYLIFTGVQASGSYYYTVAEVLAMGSDITKNRLRLEGKVAPGTISKDTSSLKLNFEIIDESMKKIPVYYEGVTPDMFQADIDVVVEGRVDKDGRFIANKLLTSCPSKYEAAEEVKKSI
ncbi:hypothetical protein MNBD_NITROSPINAE04-1111 [hydrothermal vent metagenome]|uniref:Cytochrome c-type biogenesis protein CcmE, heme chaperone n=2 Tax=hydrothermal vent metagenome TaxID=652676 RepID=A0A3B1BSJ4_9ZZZZ